MPAPAQAAKARIDLSRYELSLDGRRVKLERQPMELLILLAQRQGQLVPREDIIEKLWGKDVFVDAEHSINAAVRKIRSALRDDSTQPRYLETVVGKGYRLIGSVELVGAPAENPLLLPSIAVSSVPSRLRQKRSFRNVAVFLVLGAILATGIWATAIWRGRRGPRQPPIRSIAVLPLQNLSGDASQDYFADGMTDELITDLAQISSLRVVSRTSVMQYKNNNKQMSLIARELKVDAVVEGSVVRAGDQVRITAQLIDARDDHHLWAESYQRSFSQLLTLQNEVALDIARQVRVELTAAEQDRLASARHLTPDDYLLYLRAQYYLYPGTEEAISKAIDGFNLILSHDASAAIAYAGLAKAYGMLGTPQAIPRAREAAQRALALDPNLPDAHEAAGSILLQYDWNIAAADEEFGRALTLNPNSASGHSNYALLLLAKGSFDEALQESRKAMALDPLSVGKIISAAMIAFLGRNYQPAIELADKALAIEPRHQRALYWLGYSYEQQGDFSRALAEYAKADPTDDEHGIILAAMGRSYALSGRRADAQSVAMKLQRMSTRHYVWPYDAALFYSAQGQKELAFQWLEKCYHNRDSWLIMLNVDPRLDSLRSDPRFADLVRRVGLPQPAARDSNYGAPGS